MNEIFAFVRLATVVASAVGGVFAVLTMIDNRNKHYKAFKEKKKAEQKNEK